MFTGAAEGFRRDAIRKAALAGSAILALCFGIAIYLLDRDWASTLFLTPFTAYQPEAVGFFGLPGLVLPSLLHAYAFSLLVILALGGGRSARQVGVLSWFLVAAGLEILQAGQFQNLLSGPTLNSSASTVITSIQSYAVNGHFDFGDLVASGVGCMLAYSIASVLEETK